MNATQQWVAEFQDYTAGLPAKGNHMNVLSAFHLACIGGNDVVPVDCGGYPHASQINLKECGWTALDLSGSRKGIAAKVRITDFHLMSCLEEDHGRALTEEELRECSDETVLIFSQRYTDDHGLWVGKIGPAAAIFEFHKSGGLTDGLEDPAVAFCELLRRGRGFVPLYPRYNREGLISWELMYVELIA